MVPIPHIKDAFIGTNNQPKTLTNQIELPAGRQDILKKEDGARDNERRHMDFDDFLPHVGEFGLYQKLLFLLMIPFEFSMAQIFLTLVPDEHWCRVPELEHLSIEER